MKPMILLSLLATASPLAADPGAASGTPALAGIVAQYNARLAAPPALAVSAAAPDDDYAPESATVPGWVDRLGLSAPELRALAATVGVYAASPASPPRDKPGSSPAEIVGSLAVAVLADDAERRFQANRRSNTASGQREPAVGRTSFAALPPPPPKDLFAGRLIAFDTCGGAFFAALTRLNQTQPGSPFTAFVRAVGGTAFAGPVRADPTCGADDEAARSD